VIAVLVVSFLAALFVIFTPPRAGYVGAVSVSVRGFQTNTFGQREALVAITNSGPHVLQLATGTEIRGANGWKDSSGSVNHTTIAIETDPTLPPGTGRVIAVPDPAAATPWRVFAFCQVQYPEGWSGKIGFIVDGYLLKRRPVEKFYTSEISQ
jgi:hypothetical protein